MKKIIIKLDRFILDQLTEYIKKWIAKNEYKKHKVDFTIKMQWIDLSILILFCIAIPVMLYLAQRQPIIAFIHAFIWGLMALMDYTMILWSIKNLKPFHDQMFAMRKNPIYYNMHKEVLEQMFVEGRRRRIIMN